VPRFQTRAAFFDGGCGLCRRTVAVLWHMDLLHRAELYDVVNEWDRIEARFPQLDRAALLEDMHVVDEDGRVYKGFDAYRSLAWVLPATWVLVPILYLPPVRWLGWKVYRYVASHRHDAGCEVASTETGDTGVSPVQTAHERQTQHTSARRVGGTPVSP
jgi:predicted DCC family thiol-disulfide oxidoreductase YuxK